MIFIKKKDMQSLQINGKMIGQNRQDDMKRTNSNNLSKNSNNVRVDNDDVKSNISFTISNTSRLSSFDIPYDKKPRMKNKVPVINNFHSIKSDNDHTEKKGSMNLPISRFKTKNTEVIIDSNILDPKNKNYALFQQSLEPIVDKIIKSKNTMKTLVEDYLKKNTYNKNDIDFYVENSIKDQIKQFKISAEKQSQIQKNDVEIFVKKLVQENIDVFSKHKKDELYKEIRACIDDYKVLRREEIIDIIEKEVDRLDEKTKIFDAIIEKHTNELMKEVYSTIEEKTNEVVKRNEIIQLIETKMEGQMKREEITELIDGKVSAINMEQLVNDYVCNMITETSRNNPEDDMDTPINNFEEIIEPSIARIIYRYMKYDHPQLNDDEKKSISSNVDYSDVYDYDAQEREHFTDRNNMPHIDNPFYSEVPIINNEEALVEMGSIFKREEGVTYETNELRSNLRSRRWNRFGNGVETGNVIDVFLDKKNKKIYIAGHFSCVNRIPIENIAVYDMKDKMWKHVGEGIPQVATSIVVDEENEIVYVGGIFSKVGKGDNEVKANNIAAYNVNENKWISLGEGVNRECSAIVYDSENKKLYAGGSFTHSGTKPLNYVGVYDIESKEWFSLKGGSVNRPCRIIVKPTRHEIYMGGLFTHAGDGDNEIYVSYIAKYSTETDKWSNLSGGLQGYCNSIAYDENRECLYVGGTFTSVGSDADYVNANHVAEYNLKTQSWGDMDGGLNNLVHSIFYDKEHSCLYVGGTFTHTFENNILLNHIAKYDTKTLKWKPLENHYPEMKKPKEDEENDRTGLNGACKVLSMDNKSLFVAGSFQIAGNITANSIVRYSL